MPRWAGNLGDLASLMQGPSPFCNWSFSLQALHLGAIMPTTSVPHMRAILLSSLTVLGVMLASCRCSPATPVPITMKVINSTKAPIYVDATEGRLGLTLEREVLGQLYPFDDLACECRYCSNACRSSCTCADAGARVQRIEPGRRAERGWDGVVQVSGATGCSSGGTCLLQENAPTNEPFTLKLCYANHQPTGVAEFDDAGVALGQVEVPNQTCVEKRFMLEDGVVEIGPERGASCVTTADCKGVDELCFAGACTTGCPANQYPVPGSSSLGLGKDDMGFFTASPRGAGTQLQGTGTITSTGYVGSTFKVYLSRPGPSNEPLGGQLSISLPSGTGIPLEAGTAVSVTFVDNGRTGAEANRALVIRDGSSGQLLFAADTAQGGATLGAADLAPFAVSSGEVPIGCRTTTCGRHLYFTRRVAVGVEGVDVEPGERGRLVLSSGTWTLLSLSNGVFSSTECPVADLRPWVLWRSEGR